MRGVGEADKQPRLRLRDIGTPVTFMSPLLLLFFRFPSFPFHCTYCYWSNSAYTMSQIPQKQKAAVYDKPGSVSTKVVEIDVPEPGQGEVLVNLYEPFTAGRIETNRDRTHTGVCHSDFGIMLNSVCAHCSTTYLSLV
jgi:hypothetical protein